MLMVPSGVENVTYTFTKTPVPDVLRPKFALEPGLICDFMKPID
jgi:hypothetical protein